LKSALLERYGRHGDVYEQLTELRQAGSVDEYIGEFEYLTAQISRLPEKQYLGYFLHGLKPEIRGRVRSLVAVGDISRAKVLQVTRVVEREVSGDGNYNRSPKPGHGPYRAGSSGTGKVNGSDWVLVKGGKEGGSSGGSQTGQHGPRNDNLAQTDRRRSGPRDRGFTHLCYNELMERKAKGQCFKCKQPYHPMH
jgi:hypothetical protein